MKHNFKIEKLESIADIYLGLTYTPTYVDNGIKFISAKNTSEDFLDLINVKYISEEEYKKSTSNAKPKRGDVLFTRVGSNLGHPVIVETDEELCIFVSLGFIRVNSDKVLNSYIKYWMNSKLFWNQVKKNVNGAAKVNLNTGWLKNFEIPLPDLEEQQEIVLFLSSVDSKIEKLERKKELWEQYKKGMMQKIFSQEIRFKDENGNDYPEWEEKKLSEILSTQSSGISNNTLEKNDGNYPIYGATGFIKNVDFYEMDKDYIAVVKDGAGAGRTLYCTGYSSILSTLQYLLLKGENNLKFCYYLLNILDFNKYLVGSTIPHIYFKDYGSEKFSIPSLPEQQKIANFLSAIDSKIEIVDEELIGTKKFKKGLLQQMFV